MREFALPVSISGAQETCDSATRPTLPCHWLVSHTFKYGNVFAREGSLTVAASDPVY